MNLKKKFKNNVNQKSVKTLQTNLAPSDYSLFSRKEKCGYGRKFTIKNTKK